MAAYSSNPKLNSDSSISTPVTVIAGGFGNSTPLPAAIWQDPLDGLYNNNLTGQELQSGGNPFAVHPSALMAVVIVAAIIGAVFVFHKRS